MHNLALILSDLHCGSTVGLLPPNWTMVDDDGETPVPQRPYQKWLWACWQDMMKETGRILKKSRHALIVNGDLIEGAHHKREQIISDMPKHHVEVAQAVLLPVAERAEDLYIVRGTSCHTTNDENTVGVKLGAVRDEVTKLCAWDHLPIRMGAGKGHLCSFRHHISTSSRVYLEASALSIHLANEQLECVRSGWDAPTIVVRAHRHRHGEYTDGTAMMLVTGAWQGETRHVHKVAVGAIARPSWMILDWRGLSAGELPSVWRRVYAPPSQEKAA